MLMASLTGLLIVANGFVPFVACSSPNFYLVRNLHSCSILFSLFLHAMSWAPSLMELLHLLVSSFMNSLYKSSIFSLDVTNRLNIVSAVGSTDSNGLKVVKLIAFEVLSFLWIIFFFFFIVFSTFGCSWFLLVSFS
jgi:hypothetical protein